ncbi:hypothetical protein D3C81_1556220 [compost metagenome]
MEQRSQIVYIADQAMRCIALSGHCDLGRQFAYFAQQIVFMNGCQLGKVNLGHSRKRNPLFFRLAEDAADPGMRILNVEHGILVGRGNRQVHIKIKMGIHAAHREEVADSIQADFFHQVFHCHGFAGTFGHFDLLAVLEQADHLGNQHDQLLGIIAECRHGRLHTRDVAMVIGTPDIDHFIVAPAILITVIGDIRRKVGIGSIIFDQHAVLVVAVFGRLQPGCPVQLVHFTAVAQLIQ